MDSAWTLYILLGIVGALVLGLVIYKLILMNRAVKIDRQIIHAFFRQEFQMLTDHMENIKKGQLDKIDWETQENKFHNFLDKSVEYINKQSDEKYAEKLAEVELEFKTKYHNDVRPLYDVFVTERENLDNSPSGRLNRFAQYGLQAAAIGAQFIGKGLLGAATGTLGRGFSKNFQTKADQRDANREMLYLQSVEALARLEGAQRGLMQDFVTRIENMKEFRLFG